MYCKCGCGILISKKQNVYIHGHAMRGFKHSEKTKKKISNSKKGTKIGKDNPFYGKKHTKQSLDKISKAGINRFSNLEERKKVSLRMMGDKHHNWKGGITKKYIYDTNWYDSDFKVKIKLRDHNTCQNPDCWNKTNVLNIHHIDYNTKNCSSDNLIVLCASCNMRANFNSEDWFLIYKEIMKNKLLKVV